MPELLLITLSSMRVLVFAVALCVACALSAPLTVETLHALRRVSAHAVNAKGDSVWSQRQWRASGSEAPGEVTTNLWAATAEQGPHALTGKAGVSDTGATWGSDGNVRARAGKTALTA